jgi:RNA polymerase-binding transcription factor DksA
MRNAESDMDREELERKRQELRDRLAAIRRDLGGGLTRDLEDQAQQLENQDTLMEIARVTEQELERVERALSALDRGDGG